MRKNQKYNREQMNATIGQWKDSKLTQRAFCKEQGISISTFQYWVKKYQEAEKQEQHAGADSFIPIRVSEPGHVELENSHTGFISISYPNGINICCPVNTPVCQLTALVKP